MPKSYREVFFLYCVPGLILVMLGVLMNRADLPHLGIALMSLGLVHYGRTKGHRRAWTVLWMVLCVIYLILGIAELIQLARRSL
jgi:hypothetical protein